MDTTASFNGLPQQSKQKGGEGTVLPSPPCWHLWIRREGAALGRAGKCSVLSRRPGPRSRWSPSWTTSLRCLERGLQRAPLSLASAPETKVAKRSSKSCGHCALRALTRQAHGQALEKEKMAVRPPGVYRGPCLFPVSVALPSAQICLLQEPLPFPQTCPR